jgi:predicted transcriptional regulator of viral defense system
MKKVSQQYKTHKSISRLEAEFLDAAEDMLIISTKFIKRKTGWKRVRIKSVIASLKKKGIISSVKRDCYVIKGKISENIFCLTNKLTEPSYISFWSALSFYGYTEQQMTSVQVISTKQYPPMSVEQFAIETTTVKPQAFFGYQKLGNFAIAEKEKLFIDALYKPEKAGGIGEVEKCLKQAWKEIDQDKFLNYLEKMKMKSLFARAGYLLEKRKIYNKHEKKFLQHLPLSYTKINPQKKKKGEYIKKWMVIVNDD